MSTQDRRISAYQLYRLERATLAINSIIMLLAEYPPRATALTAQGISSAMAVHAQELAEVLYELEGKA